MYRRRLPRAVPALTALILSLLSNALMPVPAGAHALALSPDGHRLYVAGPTGGIDVIDPQTDAFITRLPIQGVGAGAALALSQDGRLLYAAGGLASPPVLVIDLAAGKVIDGILVGFLEVSRESLVSDLVVSSDGHRLYVVTKFPQHTLSVVDTASDKVVAVVPVGGNASPPREALTPNGKKLYVTGAANTPAESLVSVFDTSTNRVTTTVNLPGAPSGVAASPDGSQIYVTHTHPAGYTFDVINTASDMVDSEKGKYPNPGGPATAPVASPDGNRLYVLPFPWNVVASIDTAVFQVRGSVGVDGVPVDQIVSAAGDRLYVLSLSGSPGGSISVVDTSFRVKEIATIDLTKAPAGGQ